MGRKAKEQVRGRGGDQVASTGGEGNPRKLALLGGGMVVWVGGEQRVEVVGGFVGRTGEAEEGESELDGNGGSDSDEV
jgi:hypothetical protein